MRFLTNLKLMENYSSNCYGFMHAGLLNSEDEFYLSRDEAFEWINGIKTLNKKLAKIQWNTVDSIQDCLSENSENKYSVIEIFMTKMDQTDLFVYERILKTYCMNIKIYFELLIIRYIFWIKICLQKLRIS